MSTEAALVLVAVAFFGFKSLEMWLNYLMHKLQYETQNVMDPKDYQPGIGDGLGEHIQDDFYRDLEGGMDDGRPKKGEQ
jgi:hypothetical protein